MSRSAFTKTLSRALRTPATRQSATPSICRLVSATRPSLAQQWQPSTTQSLFSTRAARQKGIMPDTETPAKDPGATLPSTQPIVPIELSEGEYHRVADEYLEDILQKFENLQDQTDGLDIEYSSGVMTLTVVDIGTYVVNKQPPNKQIWLSSPVSGPKRYDWCVLGDGQGDKEGTAEGSWVYTRDGSSLNELFRKELDINLDQPLEDQE